MKRTFDYISRGLLLIAVGVVLILNNYGLLPWSIWVNIGKLWPLILILVGISLLFGRRIPASALVLVFLAVLVGYTLTFGAAFSWDMRGHHEYRSGTQGATSGMISMSKEMQTGLKRADVELDIGGAAVSLAALSPQASKTHVVTGEYRYQGSGEPQFDSKIKSDQVAIKFKSEKRGTGKSFLDMSFSDQLLYEFKINAGAINGDLDFSNIKLSELDLSMGACDINLSFGDTGTHTKAKISGAASDIRLYIPEGIGIKIEMSGVISETNFAGSGLILGDHEWVSPDYDKAKTKIDLDISIAAGTVKLERLPLNPEQNQVYST